MPDPLILIADPNRVRRKMLLELCAQAGIGSVVDTSSLDDTYRLAEMHRPRRVAIAADFSKTEEFQALLDLLSYISAEPVLYGDGPGAMPGDVWRLEGPAAAQRFVTSLLAGLGLSAQGPARATPARRGRPEAAPRPVVQAVNGLVLIGASTGGITALETILSEFPADCPPTLVVQHMRPGFGDGLIRRLDDLIRPAVMAAADKVPLRPGTVHVAAGNGHHLGVAQRGGLVTRLLGSEPVSGHCPSVDVIFEHGAALAHGISIRAALLTGMGADGAEGMRRLRAAGAYTIAQDRDSSVVWGMPRVAIEMGGAVDVLPLSGIARALLQGALQGAGHAGQVQP